MQIAIISPDGQLTYQQLPENDHDQLDQFQSIVEGDIQLVPVDFDGCDAFVNEDGMALHLPRNRTAEAVLSWPAALLGPVIITGGVRNEVDVGLTDTQRAMLTAAMSSHGRPANAVEGFQNLDYDLSEENMRGAWE